MGIVKFRRRKDSIDGAFIIFESDGNYRSIFHAQMNSIWVKVTLNCIFDSRNSCLLIMNRSDISPVFFKGNKEGWSKSGITALTITKNTHTQMYAHRCRPKPFLLFLLCQHSMYISHFNFLFILLFCMKLHINRKHKTQKKVVTIFVMCRCCRPRIHWENHWDTSWSVE